MAYVKNINKNKNKNIFKITFIKPIKSPTLKAGPDIWGVFIYFYGLSIFTAATTTPSTS